jgi:hypothetical protein
MRFTMGASLLTLLLTVMPGCGPLLAEPVLSVGSTAGAPGSTVQVAINFTTDTDAPALQFDLVYATNYLLTGTPVGGSALADQEVFSSEPSPGVLRVLMFSFSNSPLTNGVLVYVPFSISNNAPDHDEPLALTNVVVSSPAGTQIPAGASNGVLSIAVPPRFTAIFATNNGDIHLQLSGITGRSYVIATETNLFPSQWIPLATNVAVNGLVEVDDVSAGAFPSRFYRASFYK